MAKGRKTKSGVSGRASATRSDAVDATPRESPQPAPIQPRPPRRNAPLLALSIVLLVLWLAALVWLAANA